ncbi:MAG: choice-of-anchor D domain-containing protein [Syntrophothermus sp.]
MSKYFQLAWRSCLLLIISVMISGNAAAQTKGAVMYVDHSLLSFGLVPVNTSLEMTFKISNEGDADLTIQSITSASTAFKISPASFNLQSGSQTVSVTFSPKTYGNYSDTLKIKASDTSAVIVLKGTSVRSGGPLLYIRNNRLSFGAVQTGTQAKKKIWVANYGVSVLSLQYYFSSNTDNAFSASMSVSTIAPMDSAECEITFNPMKNYSYYGADLNFTTDSFGIVHIDGQGAISVGPVISLSNNSFDWGEIISPIRSYCMLNIKNTGNADLKISSVTMDKEGFGIYDMPSLIKPNDSYYVTIMFEPRTDGKFQSTMTINHNGADSPTRISLSGTYLKWDPQLTVSTETAFENTLDIRNYRIIGLPGKLDLPLGEVMKGRFEYDWNAVWDNGQASDYKVKYDGTSAFNFRPGNAFWILSKEPLKVSVTAAAVPDMYENVYTIPLHSGWNLISNPYPMTISWNTVRDENSLPVNAVLYSWNKGYSTTGFFAPYQGYYFYNNYSLKSLKLPYSLKGLPDGTAAAHKETAAAGMKICLLDEGKEVSSALAGLDKNASADFDTLDFFAPPGDFERANIRLYNRSITPDYKYLSCEMRPAGSRGEIFELKLKNEDQHELKLRTEGAGTFNGAEVYIADKTTGKLTDLKADPEIIIPPLYKQREYSVLIGNKEFINDYKKSVIPSEFKVNQNYPNPFNPSTTVLYSIPSDSRVEISIYNMLGEKIIQLKNAFETAGTYEVSWDASHFAAGVYFCAVTATPSDGSKTHSAVRKMILLK